MQKIVKFASVLLLVLLVFLPFHPAAASSGTYDGQVVFGQSFTLKSGETMNGDLLVFGGSATIEDGATVDGSAVLFGGDLTMNGTINGDVAVTGGSVTLGSKAHVTGNLTTVAASLNRADGSKVDGQIYNTATSYTTVVKHVGPVPSYPFVPFVSGLGKIINFNIPSPILLFWNAFMQAFGLALLSMLVMLFLAPHADRVAHAIIAQPLTAGGLGLLTVVAAPIAVVLTAITIILIPVSFVIIVAVIVAGVFGWIAIGYEIGQRFLKAIHQNWNPVFSAGLGGFVLTLVAKALTSIPVLNCIGWLVPFVLGLAALGAVIMTRFGIQAVTAPGNAVPIAPVDTTGQNPS